MYKRQIYACQSHSTLAKDLAERVEGLVGPEGVAKRIKELEQDITREEVAFEIAAEIASGKFELTKEKANYNEEQRCDQALRTALAILTEGVVAAPLEGISQVKIKQNFDSTKYIAVYFAGPIRSAGGTAAALAVLLGDKIKEAIGIDDFKPVDDEIERYVEEVELYDRQLLECKEKMRIICEGHYAEELEILQTAPGIKEESAMRIIAEIGVDMKAFLTASALVGWAGLRPRNDQSAGKIKGRKTLHGNKYLRVMLTQCAWGACRTQTSKFYSRYHTLKKRMNHNKALMANARKLLVVIWNLLAKKQPYMPFVN
mgnify:CR=1 FL=1